MASWRCSHVDQGDRVRTDLENLALSENVCHQLDRLHTDFVHTETHFAEELARGLTWSPKLNRPGGWVQSEEYGATLPSPPTFSVTPVPATGLLLQPWQLVGFSRAQALLTQHLGYVRSPLAYSVTGFSNKFGRRLT